MPRTTEEVLKDAAEIAELDKKRTQGNWFVELGGIVDHGGNHDIIGWIESNDDLTIVAHIPKMASLIAELSAALREREWQRQFAEATFAGKVCMNAERKKRNKLLRELPTPPKKE